MPTFFFSPPFHIRYHALKYSYAKFLQFFVGRSPVFSLQPATLWIDSSWSWFWGLCNGILVSRILEFKQLKLLYFFYLAVSSFLSLSFLKETEFLFWGNGGWWRRRWMRCSGDIWSCFQPPFWLLYLKILP